MCDNKRATTRSKLHFAAFVAAAISTIIIGGNASAATTTGGIITEGNARWEYSLKTDGDNQELSIMFYDKDPDATTITVPSLADLTDGSVPGITATLDTYFLKNADTAAQTTAYEATYPRRTATASTTKLDMTNTSKIQILGVKPIIDPTVETELVFGENMVIGDQEALIATFDVCLEGRTWVNRNKRYYGCNRTGTRDFDVHGDAYANWSTMTSAQKLAYIGCNDASNINSSNYQSISPTNCFAYTSNQKTRTALLGYAFSGYKLKLTNFVESNFNYIGGMSFKNSVFNAENTTMTIEGDAFWGIDIFANTNITKAIIKTDTIGAGIFRDCANLSEVEFDSSVTKVSDDAFAGSGLTSISFEGTNIKTIGPRAFEGGHLTNVNLSGINRIEYKAFRYNKDLTEIYMPKSINYLKNAIFEGDSNLKKVTVAYDTLSSGTILSFNMLFGEGWQAGSVPVEELAVLAPYGANEQVSSTHVSYDDYRWHYDCKSMEYVENYEPGPYSWSEPSTHCTAAAYGWGGVDRSYYGGRNIANPDNAKLEDDYVDTSNYKNILAPMYFYGLTNLKSLTIGEGYEYIGSSAFDSQQGYYEGGANLDTFVLPEHSLKGVGNLAFAHLKGDVDIPQSIEFFGAASFAYNINLEFDFDFPNAKVLGDYAFMTTRPHDIILNSKLVYIGYNPFGTYRTQDAHLIHDVTVDLDLFSPDIVVAPIKNLWKPEIYENGGQFHFTNIIAGMGSSPHYGTITFTNRVQTEFPSEFLTIYAEKKGWSGYLWFFGIQGYGQGFNAEKIDMSKTGWKVLPKMMTYGSYADEFLLPEHLEAIEERAFNNAVIKEPLTIPNSVKVIGDAAFECDYLRNSTEGHAPYNSDKELTTIKIASLPSSLEYIGDEAFYGLSTLTADLNAPNLYRVGIRAFQGTNVRDVLIPEGVTVLREGTFANAPSLRNITIDTDFGAAVTNPVDRTINAFRAPQSLINFFSDIPEENRAEKAWRFAVSKYMEDKTEWVNARWENGVKVEEGHYKNSYDFVGKNFETFYTIFNQTMKSAQGTYSGSNGGQETSGEHYGKVIFTDKNVTNIPGSIGVFSWLSYDEFDMAATEWTSLTTGGTPFGGATIGELHLPHGLETINNCAFQWATVEEPFEIPASVASITENSFQWAKLKGVTLNDGLKDIKSSAFQWSEIENDLTLPKTLETIGWASFMEADVNITNALPDSVKKIDGAAFFGTDFTDNLVIPGSVTTIGSSAFNAGSADVHYDKVTIAPDLTMQTASGQRVHQMFWNTEIEKLVIDSNTLVAIEQGVDGPVSEWDNGEEFYNMAIKEVTLNNIPKITYSAFNKCTKLEKVDLSRNTKIREIDDKAFMNDSKLHIIEFSPNIENETVVLGINSFTNTGFTTIGKKGSDFDLYAAHFDGSSTEVFSKMAALKKVDVPSTFSSATIPEKTFVDAPELEEATIDYRVKRIDNAAFSNDNKLKRIFIWGNTVVLDENLPDYVPPINGMGADGDEDPDAETFGPTIPEGTDIYAYSTSPTENYAAFNGRESFDGTFYPLDEVLYLTTNKTYVKIDDNKDFDKNGLTVYGLRRDGMVVESDSWAEYDDNSYSRHDAELTFAKMEPTIEENPDFGTVWDTPVPKAELNFANVNFETIDYELVEDPEGPEGVKLINIIYTDKYTEGKPDTDVLPMSDDVDPIPFIPDIIPDTPVTSAINIFAYIASFGAASGVLAVVIRNKIARSRR